MLTLVGLGLCDGNDITLRGLTAVRAAKAVYIESYTSLLQCTHEELEATLGCRVTKLTRTDIESGIDRVLTEATESDVVILVIGDVFGATTHTDLYMRAHERNISVQVIHNASIMNAVSTSGLELYRFGKTVSIPYWSNGFEPTSFLDGIDENYSRGLHTLCLLDIKADEERFMSVKEGIEHLQRAMQARTSADTGDSVNKDMQGESTNDAAGAKTQRTNHWSTKLIGCARIGCPNQLLLYGTPEELLHVDFGRSPHCIIIPGRLHHMEEAMLAMIAVR